MPAAPYAAWTFLAPASPAGSGSARRRRHIPRLRLSAAAHHHCSYCCLPPSLRTPAAALPPAHLRTSPLAHTTSVRSATAWFSSLCLFSRCHYHLLRLVHMPATPGLALPGFNCCHFFYGRFGTTSWHPLLTFLHYFHLISLVFFPPVCRLYSHGLRRFHASPLLLRFSLTHSAPYLSLLHCVFFTWVCCPLFSLRSAHTPPATASSHGPSFTSHTGCLCTLDPTLHGFPLLLPFCVPARHTHGFLFPAYTPHRLVGWFTFLVRLPTSLPHTPLPLTRLLPLCTTTACTCHLTTLFWLHGCTGLLHSFRSLPRSATCCTHHCTVLHSPGSTLPGFCFSRFTCTSAATACTCRVPATGSPPALRLHLTVLSFLAVPRSLVHCGLHGSWHHCYTPAHSFYQFWFLFLPTFHGFYIHHAPASWFPATTAPLHTYLGFTWISLHVSTCTVFLVPLHCHCTFSSAWFTWVLLHLSAFYHCISGFTWVCARLRFFCACGSAAASVRPAHFLMRSQHPAPLQWFALIAACCSSPRLHATLPCLPHGSGSPPPTSRYRRISPPHLDLFTFYAPFSAPFSHCRLPACPALWFRSALRIPHLYLRAPLPPRTCTTLLWISAFLDSTYYLDLPHPTWVTVPLSGSFFFTTWTSCFFFSSFLDSSCSSTAPACCSGSSVLCSSAGFLDALFSSAACFPHLDYPLCTHHFLVWLHLHLHLPGSPHTLCHTIVHLPHLRFTLCPLAFLCLLYTTSACLPGCYTSTY